jgi:phosphoribosylaminoimidazole (AIR) synthetase
MYEVFNMGCGFCCVVPQPDAGEACRLLGGQVIGETTGREGIIEVAGLEGRRGHGFTPVT